MQVAGLSEVAEVAEIDSEAEVVVTQPVKPVVPLETLQERFCLIELGGDIRIADREQISDIRAGNRLGEISFYKRSEGAILMQRLLETLPVNSKADLIIKQFMVNPKTHLFNSVAFSPLPTSLTTLNYWVGSTVKPVAGNWAAIKDFLLDVICNGDMASYEYLIQYLAHMLQKPEEKPGIMITLLSGQGSGKGTFFKLLHRLWARTTLLVSDVEQVIGHFNGALERHYVICLDEAMFVGNIKAKERLKSLITEGVCHIEHKYQPARSITSYHRIFAFSNGRHFAHIEPDDRRFLFLRLSDKYIGDVGFAYFDKVCQSIADENAVGAMVADLLATNLSDFLVRRRPITNEHTHQKIQSLTGFDRYWLEVLQQGGLTNSPMEPWGDAPIFFATYTIRDRYKEYDAQAERYHALQTQQISARLKQICPSATPDRKKQPHGPERGYSFPSIKVARIEFEKYVGSELPWDDALPTNKKPG